MGNLGGSLLLLVVALILIYLAVTDRLSRILDAWQVVTGKESVQTLTGGKTPVNVNVPLPTMPGLPPITLPVPVIPNTSSTLPNSGANAQVGV